MSVLAYLDSKRQCREVGQRSSASRSRPEARTPSGSIHRGYHGHAR